MDSSPDVVTSRPAPLAPAQQADLPVPPRFDPDRIAATPAMRELIEEVIALCLREEATRGLRSRARKSVDEARFRATVEAVVSDLVYQHLIGHRAIRVTRNLAHLSRRSRYGSAILNKQLPAILDLMHQHLGLIEMQLGEQGAAGGKQTEVSPGTWLTTRVRELGLTIYDTDRREGSELILLKDTRVSAARPDLVEYEDTEETMRYRTEMQAINRYLRQQDITYHLHVSESGLLVDDRSRYLRRIFTRESFASGGRLFGGFWQQLGKRERLKNTTIRGEPVVSIDYRAMLATLAYAFVGEQPPADDAYVTEFMGASGERVFVPRAVSKKLFAACIFATETLRGWPRGCVVSGLPATVAIDGLRRAHPALGSIFFKGLGHAFQFAESEILIDVLHELITRDVPALPIHDCILVPASSEHLATKTMIRTFELHQRVPAQVASDRFEGTSIG